MNPFSAILRALAGCAFLLIVFTASAESERPNILYVICDDLGYGDVHCLAPETSKIPTPNFDRLAQEGMKFTDAHSGSSVCTPTRYGILTGRYAWRSSLQSGVVTGFAPCLIPPDRPTVASFLKSQGYTTGLVGKWHLNFQYQDAASGEILTPGKRKALPPVGSKIPDGPVHRGFDYYHGFHHAREMEVVIEGDTVIEHDAVEHMLPRLTRKAAEFIESRKDQENPFFLYVPLGSPHTPIVPTGEWVGKSGLGDYGDFVMQTDHALGEMLAALERSGLADSTLVILTSDNGCSKAAGIPNLAKQGHMVSAHLRGSKADIWEGGHRIPFIARWPGKVEAGSTCEQLICLTDLFATTADLIGADLPEGTCEDSVSFLPALFGKEIQSSRAGVVHHSISGHFAYRQGKWKLALAKASGGWTSPTERQAPKDTLPAQLYDLEADPGETTNLYLEQPEVVERLLRQLEEDVEAGRSTDGEAATNDTSRIVLWKSGK